MRLVMPILANAAQTDTRAPSDPQAYCVNRSTDFYPYNSTSADMFQTSLAA
jgi:hypothetical protein